MNRDPRVDPQVGDVLLNRGVRREIIAKSGNNVRSRFSSPCWKHTEWATVARLQRWAKDAEVIHKAEDAAEKRG